MELRLGVKDGVTTEKGVSLGDVLVWNHYGTETIPPRPVLRNAAEKVVGQFAKAQKGGKSRLDVFLHNLLKNPREAKRLELVLLQDMGRQCIREARDEISQSENLQHNAPATVAKKGFDKPLEETGLLKKSLAYEVTE